MIWLTWRQFRAQALVTLVVLAVLAVVMVVSGIHLASLYDSSGIRACQAHGDCAFRVNNFLTSLDNGAYRILYDVSLVLVYVAPALMGMFWGAPLITREVENGTFRLAWNQSITRTRWLAVKLGLLGLASMAVAGLLSLMMTWWASPIDTAAGMPQGRNGPSGSDRLAPLLFGARGITPIGYAAFAFALGVSAGVLIRRTVPAMAATLAVFTGVELVMAVWGRAHLFAPLRSTSAFDANNLSELETSSNGQMTVLDPVNKPNAWVLSNQSVDKAGHVFAGPAPQACMSNNSSFNACQAAVGRLHLRQVVTYQPGGRYWAFQGYETAIFLALALALAAFCFWWVSRRRLA
jgi:hypothetical protein